MVIDNGRKTENKRSILLTERVRDVATVTPMFNDETYKNSH